MKVKCIDNKGAESYLTIGDIYYGHKSNTGYGYDVIDDNGIEYNFFKYRFEVLEDDDEDMVNHPSHYNYKSMECKDIIDIMCEGINEGQAYKLGCAIKYLYRYPMKGKPIEDLQKAKTYIDMIIEKLEGEE